MLVQISSEIYLNKSSKFLNSLVRNYGQFIKKQKSTVHRSTSTIIVQFVENKSKFSTLRSTGLSI